MNLFLSMLFSSNILFLCFLFCNYWMGNFISVSWRKLILKLVIFFSLIPLAFFKAAIQSFILSTRKSVANLDFTLSGNDSTIVLSPTGFNLTFPLRLGILFITIWLAVGIIIFSLRIYKYFHQRKMIVQSFRLATSKRSEEILCALKEELKIHFPILLYIDGTQGISFTTGIFMPIVVLSSNLDSTEFELVLRHELCHIKCHDNLYGFLRLFMLSLYWFNPLTYLVDFYYDKVSDLNCDNMTMATASKERKAEYCHLIVELSSSSKKNKSYLYTFSHHGKSIKERVVNIMTTKKSKKRTTITSTLLASIIVIFSSMPVFAYEMPQVIGIEESKHKPMDIKTDTVVNFQADNFEDTHSISNIIYDSQFTDLNGNIYSVENPNADARSWCDVHSYVSGTYSSHTIHKDGSCTMKYYNAKRCSKCGLTSVGSLQQVIDYKYCPH